ncbi:hypothetical protein HYY73_00935 [Candidatus Woesearchaeota archaeon]|nr:hypothetical protein [Candidatus Woesearchaeota archaeon]
MVGPQDAEKEEKRVMGEEIKEFKELEEALSLLRNVYDRSSKFHLTAPEDVPFLENAARLLRQAENSAAKIIAFSTRLKNDIFAIPKPTSHVERYLQSVASQLQTAKNADALLTNIIHAVDHAIYYSKQTSHTSYNVYNEEGTNGFKAMDHAYMELAALTQAVKQLYEFERWLDAELKK